MPSFNIVKECKPIKSFRINCLLGKFDLKSEHIIENFVGNINIENKKWNVGVIYGNSGTGKSSIAKELFSDFYFNGFEYNKDNILDDMPQNIELTEIFKVFNSVGFSSPPSWAKPYSVLSNGEKMRVDLARAMLENKEMIVFDEFTSVINREVAKIGSFAIQKAIRRNDKKFIAVSCHDDILEWLEPDWVFNTNDMSFKWCKTDTGERNFCSDLNLKLRSENVQKIYGSCLGNIII